jgi:hypothetical protein
MTTLLEELNEGAKMLDKIIYKAIQMLMEKWNMNNGIDGFAEFYATHPACKYDVETLETIAGMKRDSNLFTPEWEDVILMVQDQNYTLPPGYEHARENEKTVTACARDNWIQEQYARWFEGNDRFLTMTQYHLVDENKLFFNWLIRK